MKAVRNGSVLTLALSLLLETSGKPQQHPMRRYATFCAYDGQIFSLPDGPSKVPLLHLSGFELTAEISDLDAKDGVTLAFVQAGKVAKSLRLKEMYNLNGWIAVSPNQQRIAVNWSDGGALGGWHIVSAGLSQAGGIEEYQAAIIAVERAFSAHHLCRTRGNNYRALRWVDEQRLVILAEVYPTGDCGKELGFKEGYVVNVTSGFIERRMSNLELLNLPGLCTQNELPE